MTKEIAAESQPKFIPVPATNKKSLTITILVSSSTNEEILINEEVVTCMCPVQYVDSKNQENQKVNQDQK